MRSAHDDTYDAAITGKQRFVLSTKNGGERGIRTPGGLPLVGFQDRCLKPLDHLSACRAGLNDPAANNLKYSKKGKKQGADEKKGKLGEKNA